MQSRPEQPHALVQTDDHWWDTVFVEIILWILADDKLNVSHHMEGDQSYLALCLEEHYQQVKGCDVCLQHLWYCIQSPAVSLLYSEVLGLRIQERPC